MTSPRRRPADALPAATAPDPAAAGSGRLQGLDALRGIAIAAMIGYHFAFDLRLFGITSSDFYRDPFWLNSRTLILSSFLLLAGVSLVLAQRSASGRAGFRRHVVQIGACALLVSVASYLAFPARFIWFGVLHAIAVSLVLVRPLVPHPRIALVAGIAVIAAGNLLTFAAFDRPALGWLGFMPERPATDDYVPLLPWTGVMLVGIAAGHALIRGDFRLLAPFARLPAILSWMGRHGLAVYMLHQPLLLAALWIGTRR